MFFMFENCLIIIIDVVSDRDLLYFYILYKINGWQYNISMGCIFNTQALLRSINISELYSFIKIIAITS